jgi:hypothetical protein
MRLCSVLASHRWFLAILVFAAVLGCSEEKNPRMYDPKDLVPVSGLITLNGSPLSTAVVTYLGDFGLPAVGETDQAGRYKLTTFRDPGVLPGEYKVAISYMVSSDGEPQGRAARVARTRSKATLSAKEQLPPEYADLLRTTQRATVGVHGGTAFNYDAKAAVSVAAAKDTNSEGKNEAESQVESATVGLPANEQKKP